MRKSKPSQNDFIARFPEPLPHDESAERAVIAFLYVFPEYMNRIQLESDDFFYDEHRILFKVFKDMIIENGENYVTNFTVKREPEKLFSRRTVSLKREGA